MKILEFVQDGHGKLSATRLAFIAWSAVVCGVWATVSISKQALQPIDNTIVMILGIFMTGKVMQKSQETPKPPTSVSTSVTSTSTSITPAIPPSPAA